MKKIFRNSLLMMVAGMLVASCADYNELNNFSAEPDPSIVTPYQDLAPVKSYIDREANPNLQIGATLDITEFNKQELSHSAVMTNFDNVSFGKSLMSGTIVSEKGVMNFVNMMDLLEHMGEIGGTVFGSPIVANANQADGWLALLTAPIEITVDFVEGKTMNFNDYKVGEQPCTNKSKQLAKIVKYDGQNALNIPSTGKVNIIEGFEVDPGATYTVTFWAMADKDASYKVNFSGNTIDGTATSDGKWKLPSGKWTKVVVESKAAEGVTEGYLEIEMIRGSTMNIQKAEVGYYPDNHKEQTPEQKNDTVMYALNTWCDGFMKINEGRIKLFDLIDEAIDVNNEIEVSGKSIYDLKHSTTTSQIFWQDVLGSENYAPVVAKIAREKFTEYGGDPNELKFFISESGLENPKKMESLVEWIKIWDGKGALIDGITAKVDLAYYEQPDKLAECKAAYEALLDKLAQTGKLVRLTNFDIKYMDAKGASVATAKITDEQRQQLADFNAYAIKAYMSKIPKDKQSGICKSSLVDGSDPVGLWTPNSKTKDWMRTATYKAWCEALSGKLNEK